MGDTESKKERELRWERARNAVVEPTPEQILAWQEAGGKFTVIEGGRKDDDAGPPPKFATG